MIEIGSHGYSHPVIPLARWQALLQSNLPSTCGRHAKIPDGDAERPRLVDEIVLDAGAREDDQPGGHRVDHPVVALERGRLLVRSEEHTSELQSLMRSSYAVFC